MEYEKKLGWDGEMVEGCMEDFKRMSWRFDQTGVGYFPNLRFTALRLMAINGVTFGYWIPLLRTERKIEGAIEIFNKLY